MRCIIFQRWFCQTSTYHLHFLFQLCIGALIRFRHSIQVVDGEARKEKEKKTCCCSVRIRGKRKFHKERICNFLPTLKYLIFPPAVSKLLIEDQGLGKIWAACGMVS